MVQVCVISESHHLRIHPLSYIQVADVRQALAEVSLLLYGKPDQDLSLIGITGTNGKTTVTMLTKHLIGDCERTSLLGTVHYDLGTRIIPSKNHSEVHDLCRLLSLAKANGCNRTIMEVNSHGVRQKRIHGISFDTAVFLNLTRTPRLSRWYGGLLFSETFFYGWRAWSYAKSSNCKFR